MRKRLMATADFVDSAVAGFSLVMVAYAQGRWIAVLKQLRHLSGDEGFQLTLDVALFSPASMSMCFTALKLRVSGAYRAGSGDDREEEGGIGGLGLADPPPEGFTVLYTFTGARDTQVGTNRAQPLSTVPTRVRPMSRFGLRSPILTIHPPSPARSPSPRAPPELTAARLPTFMLKILRCPPRITLTRVLDASWPTAARPKSSAPPRCSTPSATRLNM